MKMELVSETLVCWKHVKQLSAQEHFTDVICCWSLVKKNKGRNTLIWNHGSDNCDTFIYIFEFYEKRYVMTIWRVEAGAMPLSIEQWRK